MAQAPYILRLLASSVTAATRAGKIIRDIMSQGELGIVEKGLNDLQTEADRSAQRCIIASLSQQFPNLTIIGEEGSIHSEVPSDWIVTDSDPEILSKTCPDQYLNLQEEDVVVWVDPLDGTSEYTQGLVECVTVLIGLSVRGAAVAGVIHQPFFTPEDAPETKGRTMWGLIGSGVGGFTPTNPPKSGYIVTTSRSHSNKVVLRAVEVLEPTDSIRVGGAGQKVLLLMEGKAHAYVFASKGTKKWDTCAPEAILRAAGGTLTDIFGKAYSYEATVAHENKTGVLATPAGVSHEELVKKMPQDVLDAFSKL